MIRNTTRTSPLSIQERLAAAKLLNDLTSATDRYWATTDEYLVKMQELIDRYDAMSPWQQRTIEALYRADQTRRPEFDQIGVGE